MTNNAELVAHGMGMNSADHAGGIEVHKIDHLDFSAFEKNALYITCPSTHGAGDVPDNAETLCESLAHSPRFLGSVGYGVIGLGGCAYRQTFYNGGLRFAERLPDLGAARIGDVLRHNASSGTEPKVEGVA
jgi:MioC protein